KLAGLRHVPTEHYGGGARSRPAYLPAGCFGKLPGHRKNPSRDWRRQNRRVWNVYRLRRSRCNREWLPAGPYPIRGICHLPWLNQSTKQTNKQESPEMPNTLDFYFEFSSPYGYLASTQIESLAEELGLTLQWHPILLGPMFKKVGSAPLT